MDVTENYSRTASKVHAFLNEHIPETMKKMISLGALSLLLFSLSAQENQPAEIKTSEFGFHAGFVTGLGLSYRHWFHDAGIQLTILPIKTQDFTFISTGFSFLYSFYRSKYIMVYGYLGNHYYYNMHEEDIYNPITGLLESQNVNDSGYNIGFGPGFAFGKVVRFNIQVGYGFHDVTDEFNLYPTVEMGVYFLF